MSPNNQTLLNLIDIQLQNQYFEILPYRSLKMYSEPDILHVEKH